MWFNFNQITFSESTHVGEEADKMKGSGLSLKQKAVQNRDKQLLMSQNTIPEFGKERLKKTIDQHYFLPSMTLSVTKKNHNPVM